MILHSQGIYYLFIETIVGLPVLWATDYNIDGSFVRFVKQVGM